MNQKILSNSYIQNAISNLLQNEQCVDLHEEGCILRALGRGKRTASSTYKLYLVVHLIPFLLGLRKNYKNPGKIIKQLIIGYLKSMIFASGSGLIVSGGVCFFTRCFRYNPWTAVFTGWICGLILLIESPGRQIQISLFSFTKGLEMIYGIIRRRQSKFAIKYWHNFMNGISLGAIAYYFLNDKTLFRSTYQSLLSQFIGDA